MKVTARQDREPIVDGILSGWKQGTDHISLLRDTVWWSDRSFQSLSRLMDSPVNLFLSATDTTIKRKETTIVGRSREEIFTG